jgi:succinate dehydrogenase flavoprotein subunit
MRLEAVGKVDSADILIIGGGIAGLVAANAALDEAPDVNILVVEKAYVPYGGQANKGAGNINYLAPEDDHDKWVEHHVKKIGVYLEDQELLQAYPKENVPNLERFDSWGGGICRDADGKIISLRWLPYLPSSMAAADIDMMNPLYKRARKAGVRFINKVAMVDLLTDAGRCVGAIGFNVVDGTCHVIQAKATMIATGGNDWRVQPKYADLRGDGSAMAYRAGAEMRNCEFGSFHVMQFARSKEIVYGAEEAMYNAKGENITARLEDKEPSDVDPWAFVLWYKEMLAGNGPIVSKTDESYVFTVTIPRHLTEEFWKRPVTTRYWGRFIEKQQRAGIPYGGTQEIFPGFVGEHGPIRVGHDMATSVPGLYGVGAAAACGSAWAGAVPTPPGRLRGGGFGMVFFTAMRGGPAAARYANGVSELSLANADQADSLRREFMAPLERERGGHPLELVKQIQNAMVPLGYCMYKSRERLEEALGMILDVKAQIPDLKATDYHHLAACNEVRSMVHDAELFYRASLERKETRGWHIREDYPDRNDADYLKWIIIKDDKGEMTVSSERVPIERYPYKP